MGVTGLWKLIEPCGKPVPVETLEGKILAIDISIWLHQVVKGFQDSKGSALPNAHLLGLFNRLCKLLYYRVKPIFVFDGGVPQLKRDTIARRNQQRSKLNTEADRIQTLLLESLAKEKVVQQALGANVELLLKSPTKRITAKKREDDDDMFKLPELPKNSSSKTKENAENTSEDIGDSSMQSGGLSLDDDSYASTSSTTDDSSSFDESNARHYYNANLQAIDVKSHYFRELPADVRHEILVDIKETRKQSSWGRLHELPSRGDDFSLFQMKRLLKRRAVQESLEEAEQEMGGNTLTYAELTNIFTEEGILESNVLEKASKQICSDEHTRYLLVRDLKKKLSKKDDKDLNKITELDDEPTTTTSTEHKKKSIDTVTVVETAVSVKEDKKLGNEFDTEMQLALAMSLEDTQVYSQSDYKYESNEQLKLNRAQRARLQNAAIGPARAYMIEYGGMNEEEVEGIMEETVCDASFQELCMPPSGDVDAKELAGKSSQTQPQNSTSAVVIPTSMDEIHSNQTKAIDVQEIETESQESIHLHLSSDSDTDSDLEEVIEGDENIIIKSDSKSELEIVLDLKNEQQPIEDDLFADVFESNTMSNENTAKGEEEENTNTKLLVAKAVESIETKMKSDTDHDDITRNNVDVAFLPQTKESKIEIKHNKASSILLDLKAQLQNVKNIKLDDIRIESSNVIELSDDENQQQRINAADSRKQPKTPIKTEIVEICDSDDADNAEKLNILNSKALKTPPKTRSILEYYRADYVVKRTPDKAKDEENDEIVPKVTSPYFVNKTPKSSRKRSATGSASTSPTPKKSTSKAAKTLFDQNNKEEEKSQMEDIEGVEPLKSTPVSTEDLIKEAAEKLREEKNEEELQTLASDLAQERRNLENERNRQDRMGMSINQRMSTECQELLRLFGIPYIIAPMEAEAQCAFLDSIELTNGTITDDSDIWLFGGRTVYKNFFAQNKHVLEFRSEKIENTFNCDRRKLIQLACLVGSDYTTGVHGIGAVTALEILASFSTPEKTTPVKSGSGDNNNMRSTIMTTVLSTLNKFRDWWLAQKSASAACGSSAQLALRKKLKNIEIDSSFPNVTVIEAYLTPKVDESRDAFTWGYPDAESIREYAKKTFGWTTTKTNEILNPVLKRLDEKKTQATIRNYFAVRSALSVQELKVSKRVQKAIDKMSGKIENDETPAEKKVKPKVKRAARKKKNEDPVITEKSDGVTTKESTDLVDRENTEKPTTTISNMVSDLVEEEPTTSNLAKRLPRKRPAPNFHNKKDDVIPQREKDKLKMLENKAKAAEILKKQSQPKKKRQ